MKKEVTAATAANQVNNLSERLNAIAAAVDFGRINPAKQAQIDDDQYYIDNKIEPPRFAYYKMVRKQSHPNEWEHDSRTTMDELDFHLKHRLHVPPEERYQIMKDKGAIMFHPSNMKEDSNSFNGCNGLACVPGCRFEQPTGVFTDEEVIAEHNGFVEYCKQKNWIMDIPLPDNWRELIRK